MKIENEKLFVFSVFTFTEPAQFPNQNLNFNRGLMFLDLRKLKCELFFSDVAGKLISSVFNDVFLFYWLGLQGQQTDLVILDHLRISPKEVSSIH